MKLLSAAISVFVSAVFAALPLGAYAQVDASALARAQRNGQNVALGGSNPYENAVEGEAEEAPDSTKTRRIRKPLESYYFSDSIRALPNFMWTVDRDMNDVKIQPLDTLLRDWRIEYPY